MPAAHQQTATQISTTTSVSLTLTLTAGNGVVVTLVFGTAKANVTLVQTAGDTVATVLEIDSGGGYMLQAVNYSVVGGSTTFTFTTATTSGTRLFVTEISSMAAAGFDQSITATRTNATTHATGSTPTLSQADEIAIATMDGDGSGNTTTTVDSGFTIPTFGDQMGGGAAVKAALAFKVLASTSAVSLTFTSTDLVNATSMIATYKAAAAAGGSKRLLVGVGR